MPRFMESVNTINSAVRTLLLIIFFTAIGFAGWLGYQTYYADEIEAKQKEKEYQDRLEAKDEEHAEQLRLKENQLAEKDAKINEQGVRVAELEDQNTTLMDDNAQLEVENAKLEEDNLKLATSLRLHKFDHRLAEITVLDVSQDPGTGETISRVEFVEIDNDGTRLEKPRVFDVKGEVVYVDHWVVNFDDKYVEQATDLDRSTALVMFRRIFGESQEPRDGFQLDQHGSRPLSYARGGKISDLEEKIWSDFWAIANDGERAKDLGIRAIHGDAVSFKAKKGKQYILQIRASGRPTLLPPRDVDVEPKDIPAT